MLAHETDDYLDHLMHRVREEVARQKAGLRSAIGLKDWAPATISPPGLPESVIGDLEVASTYAPISSIIPEFATYGRLKKRLAREIAAKVTYVSQFITNKQAKYNTATLNVLRYCVDQLQSAGRGVSAANDQVASLRSEVTNLTGLVERLNAQIKLQKREHTAMRETFDAQFGSRGAGDKERLDDFLASNSGALRGTRKRVKESLQRYIEVVARAVANDKATQLVDLGCGRGEWLELVKAEKLTGIGIDQNPACVQACRSLGLDVRGGDALEYLGQLDGDSIAAVTAFHLIEHMSFGTFLRLLSESYRVLAPGGVAIFETPNPANLRVGANTFHMDPTHRAPIPMKLARLAASHCGFDSVDVWEVNPTTVEDEQAHLKDSELARELILGAQDYALICWK